MDIYLEDTIRTLIVLAGIRPDVATEVSLSPLELTVTYLEDERGPAGERLFGSRTVPVRVHLEPRPDPETVSTTTTKEN